MNTSSGAPEIWRRKGDVLLVVPPLASLYWPSYGIHLLQALARREGTEVDVLYANMWLAREWGTDLYERLASSSYELAIGERLFGLAAFGLPPPRLASLTQAGQRELSHLGLADDATLARLSLSALQWVDEVAAFSIGQGYSVVGCTSTFAQHLPALALLQAAKRLNADVRTLLGGANCDAPMGAATARLGAGVDHVFSGESEVTFVEFLRWLRAPVYDFPRVIPGKPCGNLDDLPDVDYSDYAAQADSLQLDRAAVWLPAESSRGCWWGQVQHCTFCGLNGSTMAHRAKSSERVSYEIANLLDSGISKNICMVDNIMPAAYHKSLLPLLAAAPRRGRIFYEQKANLSIWQMKGLAEAGVTIIQPGIESLSTPLLKSMRKGITATQNIATLRYARSCGVTVNWNLLCALPGDQVTDYESIIALVPLLLHLPPPSSPSMLSIDRYSPYFDDPAAHGITEVSPAAGYVGCYPTFAELSELAYHFTGRYKSAYLEDPNLQQRLREAIDSWRATWYEKPPVLAVAALDDGRSVLLDTRPGRSLCVRFIGASEVAAVLLQRRWSDSAEQYWAVAQGYAVQLDGRCCGLATAHPEYLVRVIGADSDPFASPGPAPAGMGSTVKQMTVVPISPDGCRV